ncbi:hypothetical protein DL93DRAFT_2154361 [Clavulina sp. PMI_390]|nr:hypothetical protein DL93DRAFT_2154361 [Clavulina sp. PMI_390]
MVESVAFLAHLGSGCTSAFGSQQSPPFSHVETLLQEVSVGASSPQWSDEFICRAFEATATAYEATNKPSQARSTRDLAMHMGYAVCASRWCPKQALRRDADDSFEVFQCSRCKVPRYCGRECQRRDWRARHRAHCQALALGQEGEGNAGAEEVEAVVLEEAEGLAGNDHGAVADFDEGSSSDDDATLCGDECNDE